MASVLGFLELFAWMIAVLSLSAVVTYSVIKFSMKRDAAKEAAAAAAAGDGSAGS